MTPGIIHGMTESTYHADPCPTASLSSSMAKLLLSTSPAHARLAHPRLNPARVAEHEAKFDLGTACHALLLEDARSKIAVVDADDWRGKAAQAARAEAYAAGKTPLLRGQFEDALRMATEAQTFLASAGLFHLWQEGASEVSGFWQEESGVWCRMRMDRLLSTRIMDYKTTTSVAPDVFPRRMVDLGYHIQAAWYRRGARALGLGDLPFVFLAQETVAPYTCALFEFDADALAYGDAQVERALKMWAQCTALDEWPGYGTGVTRVSIPAWMLRDAAR